ncbi:MAG: CPBP family intramembrane glutamic endopeptidase [Terrisporobacter sp.]|uniref:CPBP family intramembrane glutamic endopeptidase n=1 Tax=Terrisporobacter sp. TaxID=1965305 RepID=UPI002FC9858D
MDYLNIGFISRSAIMQIIVFSIVPFLWWAIKYRKKCTFFKWVGLYKPVKSVPIKQVIIFIGIYFSMWVVSYFISGEISSNFENLGAAAIIPSFIVCFIQNGLCEEILFRGFVGKRLIRKFGKDKGILMQAILFGFMHIALALLLDLPINPSMIVGYFIFPTIAGWMLGYIDEKIYNGSIVPSILLHGFVNFGRDIMLIF